MDLEERADEDWEWERALERRGRRDMGKLMVITRKEARHLMRSLAVAGGWVATDSTCSMVVDDAARDLGVRGAEYIALVPDSFGSVRGLALGPKLRERILSDLDRLGDTGDAAWLADQIRSVGQSA